MHEIQQRSSDCLMAGKLATDFTIVRAVFPSIQPTESPESCRLPRSGLRSVPIPIPYRLNPSTASAPVSVPASAFWPGLKRPCSLERNPAPCAKNPSCSQVFQPFQSTRPAPVCQVCRASHPRLIPLKVISRAISSGQPKAPQALREQLPPCPAEYRAPRAVAAC